MSERCNGCYLEDVRERLGEDLLVVKGNAGSVSLYHLDQEPHTGQLINEYEGRSVKFIAWLMKPGHACGKREEK